MRVVLFARKRRSSGNFSVELINEGLVRDLAPEFTPVVMESRFESLGVWPRLYNIIEAALRQGDVNHVTGDVTFLALLMHKRKTLVTVLDCGRIDGAMDLRKRVIRWLWFRVPVARSAAVTVISQDVKRQLLSHVRVDPAKVHVVHVAVPKHFRAVPKPFNADRPVILQIGTAPNKNLPRLFAALRGIPCTLHLVGRLSAADLALLKESGIVYELFENLSNEQMSERYAACDLVSFASTFEGFGMPIVEANVVGRPVVAGNTTSMPEVAGDAACLVDPFSVESIRAGILRVIQDGAYREQLVLNGYRNARRFTGDAIARKYEVLYRMLAEGYEGREQATDHRSLRLR